MTEHTTFIEEEFETDIDIDFSAYSDEEKLNIIRAIINNEIFTFEGVQVCYSGETTVEINTENPYGE